MSVTQVSDVQAHLGRPPVDATESALWQVWIDGAEMLIADRLGPLDQLDPTRVVWVVGEAVARKARLATLGGEQVSRQTVTVDDATVTKEFRETADNSVFISDEWWAMLSPARRRRGAFTITPSYTPDVRRYP